MRQPPGGARLTVVGDDDQSIYAFQVSIYQSIYLSIYLCVYIYIYIYRDIYINVSRRAARGSQWWETTVSRFTPSR